MTYTNNSNGEILQTVEPERHPLRWLWWLLAAAVLAGIIWPIAHACAPRDFAGEPEVEPTFSVPTTLPEETVIQASDISLNEALPETWRPRIDTFDANLSQDIDDEHLAAGFRNLCAAYLNHHELTSDEVGHYFGLASISDEAGVYLNSMVDDTWCVRP
jgi:hypothetical protein